MSKHHPQSEGMKALEQSLNDHMEICRLKRKAKRLKDENARLKAEVERLTATMEKVIAAADVIDERNQCLINEVERLRKAGDALITALDKPDDIFDNSDKRDAINAWNAAKEGKQP